ncbi:MAG: phosphatase PAP2 family protein [Acidobacteriota bacterium]
MDSTEATSGRSGWNLSALVICQLSAILLLGSWCYGPTRALWDRLDHAVFSLLNGSLDGPEWWRTIWAVTNWRPFDLVPALITVGIFVVFICAGRRQHLVQRAAAGLVVALFILLVRKLANLDILEIDRKSPSRAVDSAIRLAKEFHWIGFKDSSTRSFPGDHSLFLIMLAVFFWYYGGLAFGLVYCGVTLLFSLPRMVVGAHWLTDNLVGAGFIALVSMSILLATPLHRVLAALAEPTVRKVLGRFERQAAAEQNDSPAG